MKKFLQFITEAKSSEASERAKKMGLKGDGHGGWYNSAGEFIAKTESGELKFYTKGQKPGRDVPPKEPEPIQNRQQSSNQQQQISQETGKQLTIVFGRFNPPTKGHLQLLSRAKSLSSGSDLKIYPSRSQDGEKNPIPADSKIKFMKISFPKFEDNIIDDDKMVSIFDVLKGAEYDGYGDIVIVVSPDRLSEIRSLALKYNGDVYNFNDITVVSAGEKEGDNSSPSRMRSYAAKNQFNSFKSGLPSEVSLEDAKKIFKSVQKGIGATKKESIDLWRISPKLDYKNLRDQYISKNIFRNGSIVESLNTGLIGKIIRRGTNYLICVTEDNIMFKSWIHDVVEKTELEIPSLNLKKLVKKAVKRIDNNIDGFVDKEDPKTGPYGAFIPQAKNTPNGFGKEWTEVSGVPASNREIGTDKHREYAMKMTGTQAIKNFINKYRAKK